MNNIERQQWRKDEADYLRSKSRQASKCPVCGDKELFGAHALCLKGEDKGYRR